MPRFLLVLALFFSQSYFALCLSPKNIPSHKELVQTQHNNFNKKAFEKGMLRLHSRSSYTITENIYNSSIKISRKSGLRIESKKRQEALCSFQSLLSSKEINQILESLKDFKFCQKKSNFAEIVHDASIHKIEFILPTQRKVYNRRKVLSGTSPYWCGGKKKFYKLLENFIQARQTPKCLDYKVLLK